MNSTSLAKRGPHQSRSVSVEALADQPLPSCSRPSFAKAVDIFDDVRRAAERNPEGAHAAASRLVALLTPSSQSASTGARGALAPWQKRKVNRYLAETLEQTLYVEDFASQVSLSVSHFYRLQGKLRNDAAHAHHPTQAGIGAALDVDHGGTVKSDRARLRHGGSGAFVEAFPTWCGGIPGRLAPAQPDRFRSRVA